MTVVSDSRGSGVGPEVARPVRSRPRVLIAEDSAVYRLLIQSALNSSYEVFFAFDGAAAWEALQEADAPKLLVLDWILPGVDGVELCGKIRSLLSDRYCYIVLLTARDSEEDLLTAMDAGADDFVKKPFSAAELLARLKAGSRILELHEQLIAAATYDFLTGVRNRAAIFSVFEAELVRCHREERPLGVILADIDKFKAVNDTAGHLAGDAVLRAVAKQIAGCVRTYDAVGRYGGEEFLIALPGSPAEALHARAEQIRERIASTPIETEAGPINVTVSLGATVARPGAVARVEDLLRVADSALYRAKSLGRNRVEFG